MQEVSEIANALKRMAKDLGVPVLALSQLSRKIEERKGKPLLSNLRASGSIEQDADVVMFLHREKLEAVQGAAGLIIGKNRHGPVTSVELHFDPETTHFSSLARGFD